MTDQLFTNDEALRIIAILLNRLGGDAQFVADKDMEDVGVPIVEVVRQPMHDGFRLRAWSSTARVHPGRARTAPVKVTATRLSIPELEAPGADPE